MGVIQTQRAYILDADQRDTALAVETLLELAQEGLALSTFGMIEWDDANVYYIPDEPDHDADERDYQLTVEQIMPAPGDPYEAWLAKLTLNEIQSWAEAHHDLPCPRDIVGIIAKR